MAVCTPIDLSKSSDLEEDPSSSCTQEIILGSSDKDDDVPNKKKRGNKLTADAKNLITNCYDTLVSEGNSTPVRRTAVLLKLSYNTVKAIIKKRHLKPNLQVKQSFQRVNDSMKTAILIKIYEAYNRNCVPTANSILEELAADGIIVPYKLTQFRKLLIDMGFNFKKSNHHEYIQESDQIKKLRIAYLASNISLKTSLSHT